MKQILFLLFSMLTLVTAAQTFDPGKVSKKEMEPFERAM
jgi:hypothetical protein